MMRVVALALLLAAPEVASASRTLGLVIGINSYQHVPTLDGALSDAGDIAAALDRMGASRVTTLLDQDASKENIVNAWNSLLAEAEAGDTIVLSYAGHGAQAPERVTGSEKDKMDEFWVLPAFDPRNLKATWHETVFDDELRDWFDDASARGIRVVFVSDSCHAGGMERAVRGKLRYVDLGKERILGELTSLIASGEASQSGSDDTDPLPKNVLLLAATSESSPVPEVVIDGKPRGALSWSVARALEGLADRDGDSKLTRMEIEDYVFATVRMRSESLQTPVFTPATAPVDDGALIEIRRTGGMEVASRPLDQSNGQGPVPLARDLGFKPFLTLSVKGNRTRIENAVEGKYAYEWDATKGIFRTPNGDIAGINITPYTVNDVVGKFILLDFLQAIASRRPGDARLLPYRAQYYEGERLKFEASRDRYENMLVFNLANTGEVQLLDLITRGSAMSDHYLKEVSVVPPFGADHLVILSSNVSLEYVSSLIKAGINPQDLLSVIKQKVDGYEAEVSIIPLYTKRRL